MNGLEKLILETEQSYVHNFNIFLLLKRLNNLEMLKEIVLDENQKKTI